MAVIILKCKAGTPKGLIFPLDLGIYLRTELRLGSQVTMVLSNSAIRPLSLRWLILWYQPLDTLLNQNTLNDILSFTRNLKTLKEPGILRDLISLINLLHCLSKYLFALFTWIISSLFEYWGILQGSPITDTSAMKVFCLTIRSCNSFMIILFIFNNL